MKKFGLILSILTVIAVLFACSAKTSNTSAGDNGASLKKVTVAASPVPHAEILNEVKDLMKDKGFDLEVREFSDYVQPNLAVDQGEVDANYFQHQPYLDDFNNERGTHVVTVTAVHYEPFGIYKGNKNTLDLSEGDKISVPNDVTNEARALLLLQDAGLIKLKDGAGLTATKLDIVENKYNLDIVELEAAQIPRSLSDVALACMNGNYAVEAGFKVSDALYIEKQDSQAAKLYANILCVKEGNEKADYAVALAECLKSDKVKKFIDKKYDKSVIAVD